MLPEDATGDIEIYVNGVRQRAGVDYRREGQTLVFTRSLAREGKLGFWRWMSMFLGIAGTYRKHENVDVVYDRGGRRTVGAGTVLDGD